MPRTSDIHNTAIKPSKVKEALREFEYYDREIRSKDIDAKSEAARAIVEMEGITIKQVLNKFLKDTPYCADCDGFGYTVQPDANADGSDEYTDCKCGQRRMSEGGVEKMSESERAFIKMHDTLRMLQNSTCWCELDPILQDKINEAAEAGIKSLK